MEKKKLKLSISGTSKKTFNSIEQAKSKSKNTVVIEKRSTLPILSNILLSVNNSKLVLTATDLDIIFIHQINNVEIIEGLSKGDIVYILPSKSLFDYQSRFKERVNATFSIG